MSAKFDPRWLAIGGLTAAALTATIVINTHRQIVNSEKIEKTINVDNGDSKINWNRYKTYDVELSDTYTINTSGTYHLTGNLKDGSIIINAGTGVVKIILDNVSIKNSSGPAIACYNADDLVIELVGENILEDGKTYATDYDQDVTSVIYSKADLTIGGEGSLSITANYQDGIVSKDDLKFSGGTYKIVANDDGIRGKDSVYVADGDFTIEAKADAIKSTNETTSGKGFILIEKGGFTITAGAKGIKAINSILIYGGDIDIISTDDAIHSNSYVGIIDGEIVIASGDDGVHADKELIVDGGTVSVTKSYEGLEAKSITINGGDISVVASDDGMNAGGGADNSANNRPGAGAFDADTSCSLTINGGNIYVNASGDGVDSNGYLTFNGGTTTIDGPANSGNGALDFGAGINMNGGSVIAVGASGMAESLGSSSSVYNVSIYLDSTEKAGTKIDIKDSSGNSVLTHTAKKTFSHIAAGTTEFKKGEYYTIFLNGVKYESFTISDITTTVGSNNNNSNQMMPGQNQNQRPGMQR